MKIQEKSRKSTRAIVKGDTVGKRVYVALSGGVDSSVSATLLQKEGYEVTGVFIKVWQPDFLPCSWEAEKRDAMRVSAHLGIPFLVWDFEKEYKKFVADYMIREYRAGRTPNPDVMCNKEVKFGAFFRRAMNQGADFVATGHYARKRERKTKNEKRKTFELLSATDLDKDQSYFLWTLGQEQLSKTFFPIGGFKKSKVRALAKKFKLPVAEKKDSQGLCFVGKLDMKDFLTHFITEKEGSVLNESGEQIGTHRGAYFYTLGERHGFTIAKKGADDTPYYIVAKDLTHNTITVAHRVKDTLVCARKEVQISQVNFCTGVAPSLSKTYTAQVRYHGESYRCRLHTPDDKNFSLYFEKSVMVDAGQSVALYDGDECVGGGVVEGQKIESSK
ncbi:MAG: tRNA 2-thiouridine(34) synthase MnmA [Candidatus Yonathbacteria bacterium]|nr:tRNA 2-thiouridine(34) synthase MnmA [Candidatus Yonathbacteria bacterium]